MARQHFSVRLPKKLIDDLAQIAEADGNPTASAVREALSKFVRDKRVQQARGDRGSHGLLRITDDRAAEFQGGHVAKDSTQGCAS